MEEWQILQIQANCWNPQTMRMVRANAEDSENRGLLLEDSNNRVII